MIFIIIGTIIVLILILFIICAIMIGKENDK